MTAVAVPGLWLPELWTPGKGWAPRLPKRFDRTVWRKAKEEALTEAIAFGTDTGTVGTVAGTTFTTTVTSPLVNDFLIAIVLNTSFTVGTIAMTNNAGQNWTQIIPVATDGSAVSWTVFATKLGASPSGICAGTDTQSSKHTIHVLRFTGVDNNGIGDGSSVVKIGSSGTVVASGAINTTNTNDILVGFSFRTASATQVWTAPGGSWNLGLSSTAGASSNLIMWSGYQIVSSTQTGISFPGATTAVATPTLLSGIVALVGITDPTSPPKPQRMISFASVVGRASNR